MSDANAPFTRLDQLLSGYTVASGRENQPAAGTAAFTSVKSETGSGLVWTDISWAAGAATIKLQLIIDGTEAARIAIKDGDQQSGSLGPYYFTTGYELLISNGDVTSSCQLCWAEARKP